jgi:hypothetical protein
MDTAVATQNISRYNQLMCADWEGARTGVEDSRHRTAKIAAVTLRRQRAQVAAAQPHEHLLVFGKRGIDAGGPRFARMH